MILRSNDGTRVELRPLRYQYPELTGDGSGDDWDANWLIIRGDVRLQQGGSWSFEHPCLTTSEARELGSWLRGVVTGAIQPTTFGGDDDEHLKAFTEPNLAFSLAARDDADAAIRVHLSHEARTPWPVGPADRGLHDFYVVATVPLAEIVRAAGAWEEELSAFPAR